MESETGDEVATFDDQNAESGEDVEADGSEECGSEEELCTTE